MEATTIEITDEALRKGAEEGMDGFLQVFIDKYLEVTGGVINADTMPLLNGNQHTLLGYHFFREEINEGGFVQLIQNGYGPYIFDNPFAKAMRVYGVKDFSKLLIAVIWHFRKPVVSKSGNCFMRLRMVSGCFISRCSS